MSLPPPFNFPVVIVASGLLPQSPQSLNAQLIAYATAASPGYTAFLPGIMIEDMSSTFTASVVLCDSAKVDLVNSLTPLGTNNALLQELGQMLGVPLGVPTNTTVPVVFSSSYIGYVIPQGFQVTDGTNVYVVPGGVITDVGESATMIAVCTQPGAFAVPTNTVTGLASSVPAPVTLTVTNPAPGTAGSPNGESYYAYRARINQANLAACVGGPRLLKTFLGIAGCPANAISVQQVSGGGIRVIAGGADQYQIAYAIFTAIADVSELQGSAIDSGRDVTTSLYDYPDTYDVLSVTPPTQTVTMAITWNTSLSSFTGGAAFASLVQGPIAAYINALAPGQPINLLQVNALFQKAIAGSLDVATLTRLVYSVYINGSGSPTPPASGYQDIIGDAESNWLITTAGITVTQG